MSLAMKHKRRALAKASAEAARENRPAPAAMPASHDNTVVAATLERDLDRLSAIDDVAKKIELKRNELLPKYLPMVQAYLEAGEQYSNPLLVRCAIWALDVQDMETAMPLIDACIQQQQLAPAHFKRDLPTFFAETIADWAEQQLRAGNSASPYIDAVCGYLANDFWPCTNDIVRGKVFKVAGQLAEAQGDDAEALAYYQQAQRENKRAGCKTRIEKLQQKLGANIDPIPTKSAQG